ncbi:MAG: hypothetical protein MPJ22_00845 [Pirellulales bacterium]|nr:hypothetical protein [Pirellulales bacterium]
MPDTNPPGVRDETTSQSLARLLVEYCTDGSLPEKCCKIFIDTGNPSPKRSLRNRLLLLAQGTEDARGRLQWEKVGRRPKKGARHVYIWVPKISRPDGDKPSRISGWFPGRLIPVEETVGRPLEKYKPKKIPPLAGLAEYNGYSIRYVDSSIGEYGSISVKDKTIYMCTEDPDTLNHELMHLYDSKSHRLVPGQDAAQEAVAQLGACILTLMTGGDSCKYTKFYLASYAKSTDPRELASFCSKVLGRVDRAVSAILVDARKIRLQVDMTQPTNITSIP